MEQIENAMVEDGHWKEECIGYATQMKRLDASIDAMGEAAREEHAANAELIALLEDCTNRLNAANDALVKVLKAYRGL